MGEMGGDGDACMASEVEARIWKRAGKLLHVIVDHVNL